MEHAINVYPWDLEDDPGAAERIAALGVGAASLASSYHTIRAVMPHNPRRTVLHAHHAAAYFVPDPAWYAGLRLRPDVPDWVAPDAYATAQQALRDAGLAVHAWTVLLHSTQQGRAHPDLAVENALGDLYPYALCPAHPEVRAYATALVGDLTHRLRPDAIELESWAYLGIVHGSHHDKVGVTLDPFHEHLLSLCFNPASQRAMVDHGGDPERIRDRVAGALRAWLAGNAAVHPDPAIVGDRLDDLLEADDASALTRSRQEVTLSLLDDLIQAMPVEARPRVHVHATPSPYDTGSAVGVAPERLPSEVAAIVPLFGRTPEQSRAVVERMAADGRGVPTVATVPLFGPEAGTQDAVAALAGAARAGGAVGLRYYHWGLAPPDRLDWVRELAAATEVSP